jgi:hypothetical protein
MGAALIGRVVRIATVSMGVLVFATRAFAADVEGIVRFGPDDPATPCSSSVSKFRIQPPDAVVGFSTDADFSHFTVFPGEPAARFF